MTYELPLLELQTAIYKLLKSSVLLTEKVSGVFDAVPENQPYPYVVIGSPFTNPFDTKVTNGEEINLTIHVWSDYNGKKECYELLNICQQLLNYRHDVTNFKILRIDRKGTQVFDDIDPRIRHGVLNLRYTIKNI